MLQFLALANRFHPFDSISACASLQIGRNVCRRTRCHRCGKKFRRHCSKVGTIDLVVNRAKEASIANIKRIYYDWCVTMSDGLSGEHFNFFILADKSASMFESFEDFDIHLKVVLNMRRSLRI